MMPTLKASFLFEVQVIAHLHFDANIHALVLTFQRATARETNVILLETSNNKFYRAIGIWLSRARQLSFSMPLYQTKRYG